jgi:hypothetical protein
VLLEPGVRLQRLRLDFHAQFLADHLHRHA